MSESGTGGSRQDRLLEAGLTPLSDRRGDAPDDRRYTMAEVGVGGKLST